MTLKDRSGRPHPVSRVLSRYFTLGLPSALSKRVSAAARQDLPLSDTPITRWIARIMQPQRIRLRRRLPADRMLWRDGCRVLRHAVPTA